MNVRDEVLMRGAAMLRLLHRGNTPARPAARKQLDALSKELAAIDQHIERQLYGRTRDGK